jgi:chitinase
VKAKHPALALLLAVATLHCGSSNDQAGGGNPPGGSDRDGSTTGSPDGGSSGDDSGSNPGTGDSSTSGMHDGGTAGGNRSGTYDRIGYFAQWGIYGRNFLVNNVVTTGEADKLTVINYAFENIDPTNLTCLEATKASGTDGNDPNQGTGAGDQFADYQKTFTAAQAVDGVADTWNQPLAGNFNQLKKLKAKYPKLKVLVSLGGWTFSKFWSDVAASDASRKKFVCVGSQSPWKS